MDGARRRLRAGSMLRSVEVLTWAELVGRTGSPRRARTAIEAGEYQRVLRGAYADTAHQDGPALRAAALRAVLPPGAAISHRAALWVLGVDVLDRTERLDVTARRGLRVAPRPGVRVHSGALPDEELCEVDGLLVVSAARAFVDVARSDTLVEAVAFGDAVLRSGAATADQLLAALDRAAGLRGVRRARDVLPHLEPRSESLQESRLRMVLVLGGVPRPEAQVDVYDEFGRHVARTDLRIGNVAIEYDGREERLKRDRFRDDRRRQGALLDTGLDVRRFTNDDLTLRAPTSVCAEVLRAVLRASDREVRACRGPDTLRAPRLQPLPTLAQRRLAA